MKSQLSRFTTNSRGVKTLAIDVGAGHDPYVLTLEPPRFDGGNWTARGPHGVLAISVDSEKAAISAVQWAEASRVQHESEVAH